MLKTFNDRGNLMGMKRIGDALVIPIKEDGTLEIGDFVCRWDPKRNTVWINGPQQGDVLTMAVRAIAALLQAAAKAEGRQS